MPGPHELIGAGIFMLGFVCTMAAVIWALVWLDTRDWPNPGADDDEDR